MLAHHYTTRHHLTGILESGQINLSPRASIPGQPRAVWFSTHYVWDPTSAKAAYVLDAAGNPVDKFLTTMDELDRLMGLARISVDADSLQPWSAYLLKASPEYTIMLLKADLDMARKVNFTLAHGPAFWFVDFDVVKKDRFLKIEVWNGASWHGVVW